MGPMRSGTGHHGTMTTYHAAARHVAADAGTPDPVREIQVLDVMPQRGARAIADGRTGTILIARAEADALDALGARLARDGVDALGEAGRIELSQRWFTALHEATHLTGPVIPDSNPNMRVDLMWEEALASLNARRLLPSFARAHAGVELARPALGSITYSGYAERIVEAIELTGASRDTAAFDDIVRELAERVAWRDRPAWLAERILRARTTAPVVAADVAAIEPLLHGYVQRISRGTGGIERAIVDVLARIAS